MTDPLSSLPPGEPGMVLRSSTKGWQWDTPMSEQLALLAAEIDDTTPVLWVLSARDICQEIKQLKTQMKRLIHLLLQEEET